LLLHIYIYIMLTYIRTASSSSAAGAAAAAAGQHGGAGAAWGEALPRQQVFKNPLELLYIYEHNNMFIYNNSRSVLNI